MVDLIFGVTSLRFTLLLTGSPARGHHYGSIIPKNIIKTYGQYSNLDAQCNFGEICFQVETHFTRGHKEGNWRTGASAVFSGVIIIEKGQKP